MHTFVDTLADFRPGLCGVKLHVLDLLEDQAEARNVPEYQREAGFDEKSINEGAVASGDCSRVSHVDRQRSSEDNRGAKDVRARFPL